MNYPKILFIYLRHILNPIPLELKRDEPALLTLYK